MQKIRPCPYFFCVALGCFQTLIKLQPHTYVDIVFVMPWTTLRRLRLNAPPALLYMYLYWRYKQWVWTAPLHTLTQATTPIPMFNTTHTAWSVCIWICLYKLMNRSLKHMGNERIGWTNGSIGWAGVTTRDECVLTSVPTTAAERMWFVVVHISMPVARDFDGTLLTCKLSAFEARWASQARACALLWTLLLKMNFNKS